MTTATVAGVHLGERFVKALVRDDFDEMRLLLHPKVQFRGLTPHRLIRSTRPDPPGSTLRAFRVWFYGEGDAPDGAERPIELLACAATPFGRGGRFKLSYRMRVRSRETAREFRELGLGLIADDADWLVEQDAYYDVVDGRIALMIVLCGGFQPLRPA
jgi:hypothetical protein